MNGDTLVKIWSDHEFSETASGCQLSAVSSSKQIRMP